MGTSGIENEMYAIEVAPVKKKSVVTLASIKADKTFCVLPAGPNISSVSDAAHG